VNDEEERRGLWPIEEMKRKQDDKSQEEWDDNV
jgi:hypothetical protein